MTKTVAARITLFSLALGSSLVAIVSLLLHDMRAALGCLGISLATNSLANLLGRELEREKEKT